jgi:K+-sensing histidine kinase KdpD
MGRKIAKPAETIHVEGERLDRYIQNLLDMTRLGHGGLTSTRDWIGVDELIGSRPAACSVTSPMSLSSIAMSWPDCADLGASRRWSSRRCST